MTMRRKQFQVRNQIFIDLLYRNGGGYDARIASTIANHFNRQYHSLVDTGFLNSLKIDQALALDSDFLRNALPILILDLFDRGYRVGSEVINAANILGDRYEAIQTLSHNRYTRTAISRERGIANSLNKASKARVSSIIARNIPNPQKRDLINNLFLGSVAHDRAVGVARTEMIYNLNAGAKQSWKDTKEVELVQWIVTNDERTCQWCPQYHGTILSINGDFFDKDEIITGTSGGRFKVETNIPHPPLHPRCRCILYPI